MIYEPHHWTTSYAILPHELYTKFPDKKYISLVKDWNKTELRALYSRIFKYFFYLVIKDVIINRVTFKCPPGTNAWIEMVPITGEDFAKARQNGAFADVDFLASDFTGYQLMLRRSNRYGKWTKRIYLSSKYRDMITDLTNKG
jgi:hypothetical protein